MNDKGKIVKQRIKIIQLVEDLKIGGAEKVISDMALGLNKAKFDVHVWCISRGGATADELQKQGVNIQILGITSYHNPLAILKLAHRLKREKPNIIHTHGYFASVIGRMAAKCAGLPKLVNHVHSTYWDYKKRNIRMEKFLSRWTSRIICCSEAVKDFVINSERIDPSKTSVIYNGVDVDRFFPLTVSSLAPHKGHVYLIEAAAKVLENFPTAKFLIIGDGVLRNKLEKQTRDLNLSSSFVFTGTRTDIPELLAALDVFVLPSSREGLGISIIEAMAAAKPVVATYTGGIPEVVLDDETGFLVAPQNPNALARAIFELLDNPEKAAEMGRRGKERVKDKFTKERMISEIENLYESLFPQEGKY
jgi:glycosyltransferase involved in cell wall biosynthesis